jgi:hypothetical protein
VTRSSLLNGLALIISGVMFLAALGGFLAAIPPANPGAANTAGPHRLPRMIPPNAFSPDWNDGLPPCDLPADLAEDRAVSEVQAAACYAADEPEDAAVGPRDAPPPAMAVSWP